MAAFLAGAFAVAFLAAVFVAADLWLDVAAFFFAGVLAERAFDALPAAALRLRPPLRADAASPWSKPVQLDFPRGMTSRSNEAGDFGPALSADGGTLIFHSTRAGGQGGDDLWQVRRVKKQ